MMPSCATTFRKGATDAGRMNVDTVGRDAAEERRSQNDPGQHLADDWRLAGPLKRGAEQAAEHDDGHERQQHVQDGVGRRAGGCSDGGAGQRRIGRRQGFAVSANEQEERNPAEHHGRIRGDERNPERRWTCQFIVHRARVDTSFTNIRLPEMSGCVHVSESATL